MNKQKGFSTILLIVVLLAVSGGVYYFAPISKEKNMSNETEDNTETQLKDEKSADIDKDIPVKEVDKFTSYRNKKNTNEYTTLDKSHSLFAATYGNYNVGLIIEHDETNSYEGVCDSFYANLEKNYNSFGNNLDRLDLNQFVKDFKCTDNKDGYEVRFSLKYNSGYYRDFILKAGDNPLI